MAGAGVAARHFQARRMSRSLDPTHAAINDARVLLAATVDYDWREAYIKTKSFEIFIGWQGARANPMRSDAEKLQQVADGPLTTLKAPHVATIVALASDGSTAAKGDAVATLSVLGEEEAVLAPADCVVERAEVVAGTLVEFDQPLLILRERV